MKKILFLILNFGTIAAFAQNSDLVRSLNMADSLSRTKNYEKADAAFSDIIKTKPDWAVAYAKRAMVRLSLNKLSESSADIAKAQELDGTNRLVVAAKKKYDDALEAMNPTAQPAQNRVKEPEIASKNELKQQPESAREENFTTPQTPYSNKVADRNNNGNNNGNNNEERVTYDPKTGATTTTIERTTVNGNSRTHTSTTTTRTERNTYTPAENAAARPLTRHEKIAQYSEIIRQNPNDSQAYAERGLQYGILGNDFAALQDYNMALQINPNNGNAYYLRGVHYVTKGGRRTRAKGCADLQRAAALGMSKANEVLARECR